MELLAFGNGIVQIGVILVAARYVQPPAQRRLIYWLSGTALACSVAGLLAAASTGSASGVVGNLPDIAPALTWLLYVGGGLAVLFGIVAALRNGGATRFAWKQGRYQRYRQYRRI